MYDYVIVGAGSAECVLANRLSRENTVLLLEAGEPDEEREFSIPAAYPELFGTDYDWEFYTTPQPEMDGREMYWPKGKAVGGSSSLSYPPLKRWDSAWTPVLADSSSAGE